MAPAPVIRSPQNPRISYIRSLRRANVRRRTGHTYIEGPKLIAEAVDTGVVESVLYVARATQPVMQLVALAQQAGATVRRCTTDVFAAVSDTDTPQGALAVIRTPTPRPREGPALLLALDGVQDPGNVGAIFRCAAAAGATGVVCGSGTADPLGPKAMRAGAGAQLRVPISGCLPSTGIRTYAAEPTGIQCYTEVDWTKPSALIVGSEGQGISVAMRDHAHSSVKIPLAPDVESLNVATAAAVILFEAARQRRALEYRGTW